MPPRKKDAKGAAAPTVMLAAMDVSKQKPHGSAAAPEEIRKVQSTGNLRGGDGATAASYRAPPGGQPVTDNATGYTSDTAVPTTSARQRTTAPMRGVPWTEDEHRLFLLGLQKLGRGDWRGISRHYVLSRNPTQVASHAQKYFIRQSNLNKRKRRSSLFDIVSDVGPAPGQAGHIPHALHTGVNAGTPGIPPAGPRGRGPEAASSQPHLSCTSPPLTAEGAAALAVAAAGGTLPHGLPYFAYPPGGHPVHHVGMGVPNMGMPNMPITHALPWGYPGMGMLPFAMPMPRPVGAKPEKAALSANPKLCKPTATLATPNNWPLRFPLPGMPEYTAMPAVATTVAKEVVAEVVTELPAVKEEEEEEKKEKEEEKEKEGAERQSDNPSSSSAPSAASMAAAAASQPTVNMQRVTSSNLYNLTDPPRALVTESPARSPGGSTGSGRSMEEVLDESLRALRRSLDEGVREVAVRQRSRSSQDGRRSRGPSIDEGHHSIPIAPG